MLLPALLLVGCFENPYPCYFTIDMHRICVESLSDNHDALPEELMSADEYEQYVKSSLQFRAAIQDHFKRDLDHMTMMTIIKDEVRDRKAYEQGYQHYEVD